MDNTDLGHSKTLVGYILTFLTYAVDLGILATHSM